jgi:hypothetical protein
MHCLNARQAIGQLCWIDIEFGDEGGWIGVNRQRLGAGIANGT